MSQSIWLVMFWVLRNSDLIAAHLIIVSLLIILKTGPGLAQNNIGYPNGIKCEDLVEPRRSACADALDPRPNAQELLPKRPSNKVILPRPSSLGHDAMPTHPKIPQVILPPIIKKQ